MGPLLPIILNLLLILLSTLHAVTQQDAHAFVLEGARLHRSDPSAAEAQYDIALAHEPENPDALHLKGLVRHDFGDSKAGVTLIVRAIEARGGGQDTATMWSNLGEVYRGMAEHELARSAHERAVALNPASAAVHFNYGEALLDAGELGLALETFGR